jgi:hypothetical protein
MNILIEYFVDSGYDADDLREFLGIAKAASFIHRLCSGNPSKIENNNFLVHVEEFIRDNIESFTKIQLVRL